MLQFEHGAVFQLRILGQSNTTVTLTIRGLTREGPFSFKHTIITGSAVTAQDYKIPDIPIMLTVENDTQNLYQNDCYIAASLLLNGDKLHELCSGFVYRQKSISWPYSNTVDIIPGHGRFKSIEGLNPAAGAECSMSVPADQVWHVLYFYVQLVTDATVANRRTHLVFNNNNGPYIEAFSSVDQAASLTRNISAAQFGHVPDEIDDNDIIIPIPQNMWLLGESQIATATVNKQAGDNYGKPIVLVEQYFQAFT